MCLVGSSAIGASPPDSGVAPIPVPVAEGGTGCLIKAPGWRSEIQRTLRLSTGQAFASLTEADSLTLTSHPSLELETVTVFHAIRLKTIPRPSDFPVFSKGDLLFGSIASPGKGTPLTWALSDTNHSQLRLGLPRDPRVQFETAPVIDAFCSSLQLQQGSSGGDRGELVKRARALSISGEAGGPPVAQIRIPKNSLVDRGEQVGSQVHLRWFLQGGPLDDTTIAGWVDADRLIDLKGTGTDILGRGGVGIRSGDGHPPGCISDKPLFVQVGHRQERVGEVVKGTDVDQVGTSEVDGKVPVRIHLHGLTLLGSARWLMKTSDAEDCQFSTNQR